MRSEAPPLVPILRSAHQAEILALLLLHPDEEFSLTDLARRTGVALSTVHGEVTRLLAAGVVRDRDLGRSRLVRVDTGNRLVRPLTDLLTMTYGPHVVVGEEFATLAGVEQVLVFGSWAARYHGEPGPPPHDVDVLVVGTATRADVYDAAERAERRLGIPVNPTIRTRRRWLAAADALVQQIRTAPYVVAVDHRDEPDADAVG